MLWLGCWIAFAWAVSQHSACSDGVDIGMMVLFAFRTLVVLGKILSTFDEV